MGYQAFRKTIYENRLTKINSKYLSYKLLPKFFENEAIRKLPVIQYNVLIIC